MSVISNTMSTDNVKTKFHMERVGGGDESNNNFNLVFFFLIGLSATVSLTQVINNTNKLIGTF